MNTKTSSRHVVITIDVNNLPESMMADLDTQLRNGVRPQLESMGEMLRQRVQGSAYIVIEDSSTRVEDLDLEIF